MKQTTKTTMRMRMRKKNKSIKNKSIKNKSIKNKSIKNKSIKNKVVHKDIIYFFLQMINAIKLFHWKTTDYATHKATDQLYADLNLKIDQFVEVLLGKNSAIHNNNNNNNNNTRSYILNITSLKLPSFKNNNDLKKEIDHYKIQLMNLTSSPQINKINNSDLLNIRDEILALLNQFLYLLTLN